MQVSTLAPTSDANQTKCCGCLQNVRPIYEDKLEPRSFAATVIRHGDRSPIFNPFEGSKWEAQHESIWLKRIRAATDSVNDDFPKASVHSSTIDGHEYPWGILSDVGVR